MRIQEVPFNQIAFMNTGELYGGEIVNDRNIFFHGTSSVHEEKIESQGIVYNYNSQIESWIKSANAFIGELLPYCIVEGVQEKYVCLSSDVLLSLQLFAQRDFAFAELTNSSKRVFITVSDQWAFEYARKKFAGGEALCAIRLLQKNLASIIAHYNGVDKTNYGYYLKRKQEYLSWGHSEAKMVSYKSIDLGKIHKFYEGFSGAFSFASMMEEGHAYGLIYGIRIDKGDAVDMRQDNTHFSITSVPAEKIIYKLKVPPELDTFPKAKHDHRFKREYWKTLLQSTQA